MLPAGVRLLAGEIPFETLRPASLSRGRLTGGLTPAGEGLVPFSAAGPGGLRLEVFGAQPRPGAAWYLRFDGPWSAPLHLHLWMKQDWPVERNPAGPDTVPLTGLAWEALEEDGWRAMKVSSDETWGLLFSGDVTLEAGNGPCLPLWEEEKALPGEGRWLRGAPGERGVRRAPPCCWGSATG